MIGLKHVITVNYKKPYVSVRLNAFTVLTTFIISVKKKNTHKRIRMRYIRIKEREDINRVCDIKRKKSERNMNIV